LTNKKRKGVSGVPRLFLSFLIGLHSRKPSVGALPKLDYGDPVGYCTAPEAKKQRTTFKGNLTKQYTDIKPLI
jgi:hypothetical protein